MVTDKTLQYTARLLESETVLEPGPDPYKITRLGRCRGGQSDGDQDICRAETGERGDEVVLLPRTGPP